MRICIVAEGCYPYVVGGVSGWIDSLIKSFPQHEFVILAIIANREWSGRFKYQLPENVSEVHEVYLLDDDWYRGLGQKRKSGRHTATGASVYETLKSLLLHETVDWTNLFGMFRDDDISLNDLLMGEDFMHAATDVYRLRYQGIPFSDYLWTMRSIMLPLFNTLKCKLPEADLYHCVATGYAGVLGAMAKSSFGCKLLISEHGLYTREREEELIKATWVQNAYKVIWIDQFKKMADVSYSYADMVTSLYEHARELQIEGGCPAGKTLVTPNGIDQNRLADIPGKDPDDEFINVGAVLRVTPIKDVKTLINAFYIAKRREPRLKLWIMGPMDEDPDYTQECQDLVESLAVQDVVFTGRIDVRQYLGKMDMTILTSLSEGQPLTVLESYAARKPAICTDVGNCRGLLYGEDDDFGEAGILCHIMNTAEIATAMVDLARDPEKRERMAQAGYERLMRKYKLSDMKETYQRIYRGFSDELGLPWPEEDGGGDSQAAAGAKMPDGGRDGERQDQEPATQETEKGRG